MRGCSNQVQNEKCLKMTSLQNNLALSSSQHGFFRFLASAHLSVSTASFPPSLLLLRDLSVEGMAFFLKVILSPAFRFPVLPVNIEYFLHKSVLFVLTHLIFCAKLMNSPTTLAFLETFSSSSSWIYCPTPHSCQEFSRGAQAPCVMSLTWLILHFSPCRQSCRTAFIPPWCNAHHGPWLHPSKSSTTTVDPVIPLPTTTPWQLGTWSWRTCWKSTSPSPSMSPGKRSFRGCHQVFPAGCHTHLEWGFGRFLILGSSPGSPFTIDNFG